MNIGIFTDTYYPELNGVANSAYQLKEGLERLGNTVYVFTVTNHDVTFLEKNVYRIVSLPCPLIQERRVGLPLVVKWGKKIEELNLDIIHTQTEFSIGILGKMMAKRLNIPVIHTYHTVYEDYTHYLKIPVSRNETVKGRIRKFTRSWCNRTDGVIAPTVKTKKLLLSYGVKAPINIQPTGIDIEKFKEADEKKIEELKSELGIEQYDEVFVSIGRLSKEKNLEEILGYMPEIINKHEHFKLVIVGDGPYRSELEAICISLGLKNHVKFAGAISWDVVQNYYHIGKAFVCASRSETQGLTYVEAMAAGVLVIARKDDCLSGVIENNLNGLIFESENEFIKAVDVVLESKNTKRIIKEAQNVVLKYGNIAFAKNVLQIYEKVLSNEKMAV